MRNGRPPTHGRRTLACICAHVHTRPSVRMRSDSPSASDRPQLHTCIGNATTCNRALTRGANSGGHFDDHLSRRRRRRYLSCDFFADSLTCRDTCNPFQEKKFTGICGRENLRRGSCTCVRDSSSSMFSFRHCYQTENGFPFFNRVITNYICELHSR